jgi:plastocyanin
MIPFEASPRLSRWYVLLVLLALAGCGSSRNILLRANGMSFSQTELTVRAGEAVSLELFNMDGYAHSFDIDEFDVHAEMPASETLPLTFTPDVPGVYEFYCGTAGHRAAGMAGTLIVEP